MKDKNCCEKFSEALAENIIHDWNWRPTTGPRYVISSEDDSTMDLVYCPFCGKKLEEVKP
jgi:hypothetical protein